MGQFARDYGLEVRKPLRGIPDAFLLGAATPAAAAQARQRASADPRVRSVYQNGPAAVMRHDFVPNDPYYAAPATPTTAYSGQWHLQNGAAPNCNIQILPAWKRDLTGAGVTLQVVDDGMDTQHPDLIPNYVAAQSWNFGTSTPDPDPVNPDDDHGTATSGLAGARGGNRTGVSGSAPFVSLSHARIDFDNGTLDEFAQATAFKATTPDVEIMVKNHSYGDTQNYQPDPEVATLNASAQSGVVHLYSAGNARGGALRGGPFGMDDCNRQALTSSPDNIVVAALGAGGTFASYSSYGAAVFICAPSFDGVTGPFIVTTDRSGAAGYNSTDPITTTPADIADNNYTALFGGTSASAPIATGIMALARQVQPGLNVRLAKHLLVRSCLQVDLTDSSVEGGGDGVTTGSAWHTNGAGFKFNENYGFGLIQADGLTQLAQRYASVTPLVTESVPTTAVAGGNIGPGGSFAAPFSLTSTVPLEDIQVTLAVTTDTSGQVEATLKSPSGTVSRLVRGDTNDTNVDINWTYISHAFWGENPSGTWTLTLKDINAGGTGDVWTSYSVTTSNGTPVLGPFTSLLTGPETASTAPVKFTLMLGQAATGGPLLGKIAVTGGTVSSVVADPSAKVGGTIYDILVSPTGPGTITCQVASGACTSVAGALPSPAAGPVSTLYDGSAVTCTVTAPAFTNQSPIPFTITFSESVTGLTPAGLVLSASAQNVTLSGSGTTWTALVTPSSQTSVTCSVSAGAAWNAVYTLNSASNTASSTYDTTPPNTALTAEPANPTFVSSATFTFTSTEANSTFQISLDGAAPIINSTGTITFTNLISGTHTISIAAVDQAGNVDPTPIVYTWTIPIVLADTTAPLLNPFDTPYMTTHYTFTATGAPAWAVDATPGSVLGSPPYFTGPASLNYNNGVDDSSGGTSNSGTVTTNQISLGSLTTARLKFMCNYGLAGPETRTLTLTSSNVSTPKQTFVLSSITDPGLGLCAPAGVWHEHTVDVTGLGPSLTAQFAFNTVSPVAAGSPGWFVDDLEISDLLVSALGQYPTGSPVPIPVEGDTLSGSIDFKGIVSQAALGAMVQLDIEVKPLGTAFDGTVSGSAQAMSSGGPTPTTLTVTLPLSLGSYHWRARTVSPPSTGTVSSWMEFGLNASTDPDFSIVVLPPSGGGGGGGCGATGFEAIGLALLARRLARRRRRRPVGT